MKKSYGNHLQLRDQEWPTELMRVTVLRIQFKNLAQLNKS